MRRRAFLAGVSAATLPLTLAGISSPFLGVGRAQADPLLGDETQLPLPRFVSIKSNEANVRRGPGLSHRIDWVFQRRHLPVQITAEHGHWRRIRDVEGAGGWVHYSLLSGSRYVLVMTGNTVIYEEPDPATRPLAKAEPGVVARLGACTTDWCEVSAGRRTGWTPKAAVWGVGREELRD